jgi:hypothetical protein
MTRSKVADGKLSPAQIAMTSAFVSASFFILCWSAGPLPGSLTLPYVEFLTKAEPSSSRALIDGIFWSALGGYSAGAIGAVARNLWGTIRRRRGLSK